MKVDGANTYLFHTITVDATTSKPILSPIVSPMLTKLFLSYQPYPMNTMNTMIHVNINYDNAIV